MLCIRTQAFILGSRGKWVLEYPAHSEADSWQAVVLPFYTEVEQRSAKAKPLIDLRSYSSQVKVRKGKVSWEECPEAGWTSRDLDNWLLGEGMNEWLGLNQVVLLQPTTEGQMPIYCSCFPLSNQTSKSPRPASWQTAGNLLCRTPRKPYFNQGYNQGNHPISPQCCPFQWKLLSLSDSTCSFAFTGGSGPGPMNVLLFLL